MASPPIPKGPYGMLAPGNIDPSKRPIVRNPDGSISTVRSISIGTDQGEVLIPTISPDGRALSDDEAIALFEQIGQNLGTFRTPDAATMFARNLHSGQEAMYADQPAQKRVYTIQSPDGRKIKIEAADEATAMRGAQEWAAANPAAVKLGGGPVAPKPAGPSERSENVQFAPGQEPRPSLGDEVMSFGRGVIEGVPIAGPFLADARRNLDGAIMEALHGGNAADYAAGYKADDEELRAKTGGARTAGNVTGAVATLAPLGATAVGGRLLGTAGSVGQRMLTGGVSSALISGADTAARGGDLGDIGGSAGLGGFIGGALPVVGAGVRRLISPSPASAAKTASADVLRREGVDLTGGQATGNRNLRFREAELGGGAAEAFGERQADQFTAAALRRVGVDAPRATHDVIDTAFSDIGRQFDDVAARNFIQPDQRLATDLQAAWRRFEGSTNPSTRPPVIQRLIADIYGGGQGQRMSGEWYKSTRSELGRLSKSQNPELAEAARDLQHALDDAMARSIQQYNPADAGAWQEVRRLYRNMLVIEDAATRAGAASAEGVITPQALRSATIRHNKRSFARGQNDFVELADAGVSTMTPLPDSGTPGRLSAKVLLPAGAITGAGFGSAAGPVGAIAGGALGALLPPLLGRAALSGPGRAYLGNQIAAGPAGQSLLPPSLLALLAPPN